MRNTIAVGTDQLYIRATPYISGFASNVLRELLVSFWDAIFAVFRAEKCVFYNVFQTKIAFKINLLMNFLDKEERVFT